VTPIAPFGVRGTLLPGAEVRDLYVVGGRITLDPVPGAPMLADAGWIVPGLVDAHCHIGLRTSGAPVGGVGEARELALVDRDTGVLAIRDAGSPVPYPRLDLDPQVPRLVRAGRHLAPPGRYVPGVALECAPHELTAAVAAQARAGNGWVKLVADYFDAEAGGLATNWDAQAVRAGIAAAHRLGVRVAAHTLSEAGAATLLRAGVDSVEHGTGLTPQLLAGMAERRVALVPTMLAVRAMRAMAAVAHGAFPGYAAHLTRLHDGFPELVRAAYDAGVPMYVGTDAGCEVRHGRIAEEMLALNLDAGIPAADVLAAASWRAREWLGLGQLDEGGPADLLVYDEDPRRDLRAIAHPRHIVLRGRVLR
jgi:imidazolonepropionase-like amidohydrolase